jgi:predicted kinase
MAADAAEGRPGFEALLSGGDLDVPAIHALADRIAAVHVRAARASPAAIAEFRATLTALARSPEQVRELGLHAVRLDNRARVGRVRELDGVGADTLFDLALPLMELWRSGLMTEANILANRYVDVAPQGAGGWALLPLFASLRAEQTGDTAIAAELLLPSPPRLIAIGGLSGTGKSTLSRLIGARTGRVPGARVLRSDVFRKRLAGVSPETRLPPGHYTPRSDAETYEALFESADDHLACGSSVILDAVFMSRSERDVAEMLALRHRLRFEGIWLEAPERDRIARVNARTGDASDATAEVVHEQSRRSTGDVGYWHRMRVNRPQEMIVAAARAILDRAVR